MKNNKTNVKSGGFLEGDLVPLLLGVSYDKDVKLGLTGSGVEHKHVHTLGLGDVVNVGNAVAVLKGL